MFCFADIQKLCFSSLVLTMLLSMGEALPVQHYGRLTMHHDTTKWSCQLGTCNSFFCHVVYSSFDTEKLCLLTPINFK